jgi:hypothetical protein
MAKRNHSWRLEEGKHFYKSKSEGRLALIETTAGDWLKESPSAWEEMKVGKG